MPVRGYLVAIWALTQWTPYKELLARKWGTGGLAQGTGACGEGTGDRGLGTGNWGQGTGGSKLGTGYKGGRKVFGTGVVRI